MAVRVEVGKRYTGGDPPTIYQVEAVAPPLVTLKIITAPGMHKRKTGKLRTVELLCFERWAMQEVSQDGPWRVINLAPEDFEAFMQIINGPPDPDPRLVDLMRGYTVISQGWK